MEAVLLFFFQRESHRVKQGGRRSGFTARVERLLQGPLTNSHWWLPVMEPSYKSSLKWFTYRDLSFAVDTGHSVFISSYKCLSFWLIKSKMSYPGPCVLASRGVVLGRRKSLELIIRKVCSLFGGETASQQVIVKIKAWGKDQAWNERDVSSLQPAVYQKQSKT